jgi:hypothetical protein
MIDYGAFHFSSSSGTGEDWFLRAVGTTGLVPMREGDPHEPQPRAEGDSLRVSLVCHPCVWLQWSWSWGDEKQSGCVLDELDRKGSMEEFVWGYLVLAKGAIGKMMFSHDADSYIRTEDLPDAFVELMKSVGMPCDKGRLPPSPKKTYVLNRWNPRLKSLVMDAEKELVSHFDYF